MLPVMYHGDNRNKIVALSPLDRHKHAKSRARERDGYRVNRIVRLCCIAANAFVNGALAVVRRLGGHHTRSASEVAAFVVAAESFDDKGEMMTSKPDSGRTVPAAPTKNQSSKSKSAEPKQSILNQPSERLKAVASALNAANNKVDAFKR